MLLLYKPSGTYPSPWGLGLDDFQVTHDLQDKPVQICQEAPAECQRASGRMKALYEFPLDAHVTWLETRISRTQRDLSKDDKGRERKRHSRTWRSQTIQEASRPKKGQLEKLPQPPSTPLPIQDEMRQFLRVYNPRQHYLFLSFILERNNRIHQ